jgi:hypothetical protein
VTGDGAEKQIGNVVSDRPLAARPGDSLPWNRRWKTPMADDPPWTRDDLIRLIAGSLKRSLTYLNSSQAEVMADSVLRDLKAAGLRIVRPKKPLD